MSFVPKVTEDDIPSEFICPITNEIMKHPLMSIHGHNYERDAIFEWLGKHSTCPLSRRELSISKLVTNCALKGKILAWCDAYDMMHLLKSDQDDDDDDDNSTDPRHRIMGINLTEKQEREVRQLQAKRRRHVRRALDRLARRRRHVAARVVLNLAA